VTSQGSGSGQRKLILLLTASLLSACAPDTSRVPRASVPEDTVTFLYYSADPSTWTDFGQPVLTLLFSPLMHEHAWEVESRLARSREVSPDPDGPRA